MEELLLFRNVLGINTKVDPVRLRYDPETGVVELSQALNIMIDDTGRPGRRPGRTTAVSGSFHSLFCEDGDCYVGMDRTSDCAIYKVATDLSTSGVRSGLTKSARISFCQVNADTYYGNGYENGFLRDGASYDWPANVYKGPTPERSIVSAPVGKHLAFYRGRMLIGVGNTVWFTERWKFGLVEKARMHIKRMSDIRMIAPVKAGLFISDENKTYFFTGTNPLNFEEDTVAKYPAHEYSLAHDRIEVRDINMEMRGFARLWSSPEGTCLGLPDGTMLNINKKKIDNPDVRTKGASVVLDGPFGIQGITNTY